MIQTAIWSQSDVCDCFRNFNWHPAFVDTKGGHGHFGIASILRVTFCSTIQQFRNKLFEHDAEQNAGMSDCCANDKFTMIGYSALGQLTTFN